MKRRPVLLSAALPALLGVLLSSPLTGGSAVAADGEPGPLDEVRSSIEQRLPGVELGDVSETPAEGFYEVIIDGGIYYADRTGSFLLEGNLIDLESRSNLTENRLGSLHMGLLAEMDEADMLIYDPEEPSDRSITVFTDISCGYCRRFHADLDTMLEAGVRVRYLLFPRAGLGSQGAKDLESVWCADNPQEAMTVAKSGGSVPAKECANPIEKHVALAERVGLRGTPLMYTDAGERIPGFREPAALAKQVLESEPLPR